jgi:hypothetical protein
MAREVHVKLVGNHERRPKLKWEDNIQTVVEDFILKTPCILSQSLFKNTNWMHFYLKKTIDL